MYLTDNRPLLMNHNSLIGMAPQNSTLSQVQQSALVLTCVAKYYCVLKDEELPPDGFESSNEFIPYDMSQFKNLGTPSTD